MVAEQCFTVSPYFACDIWCGVLMVSITFQFVATLFKIVRTYKLWIFQNP